MWCALILWSFMESIRASTSVQIEDMIETSVTSRLAGSLKPAP